MPYGYYRRTRQPWRNRPKLSANRDGLSVLALLGRPARRVSTGQHERRGKGVTSVKDAFEGRDRDPILARLTVAANWDSRLSKNGLVILAHTDK
jgi:hypothetical protein